MTASVNDVSDE